MQLSMIENLGDVFFVMNGDVLSNLDYRAFYKAHLDSGAVLSVATYRREVNIDFGVLGYDDKTMRINSFEEKPTIQYDVSMGIYLLSRRCLEYIPHNEYFGFDNLVLTLRAVDSAHD